MEKIDDFVSFIKEKRNYIIFGIILLVIILLIITSYAFHKNKDNDNHIDTNTNISSLSSEKKEESKTKEKKEKFRVEIKGEVKNAGVYTLDSSKRVIDVINMAGGLTRNADISIINQSMKIKDEMVIIIYSKEQVISFVKNKKIDTTKIELCKDEVKVSNDACISNDDLTGNKSSRKTSSSNTNSKSTSVDNSNSLEKTSNNNKISLNTASVNELTTLPGIGESKAKSIIEYREKEGLFDSIEDIMKVSGIGEALFEKIKDNITV